jgi:Fe-S cluster assembly scaffold protein SufB
LAKLTHEASIGRINDAQLMQLMAKGLTEEEATELIIKGLLGE